MKNYHVETKKKKKGGSWLFLVAAEGKQKQMGGEVTETECNNVLREKSSCQMSPKEVKITEHVRS